MYPMRAPLERRGAGTPNGLRAMQVALMGRPTRNAEARPHAEEALAMKPRNTLATAKKALRAVWVGGRNPSVRGCLFAIIWLVSWFLWNGDCPVGLQGFIYWTALAAATLLLPNLVRPESGLRVFADVLRAILTILVAVAAIRADLLRRDGSRRLDAAQESLTLAPPSEERPRILIYRTADDRETRRRQMELLDMFVVAKWDAQAPDEILTNAPQLTGLGWVRFGGPATREQSGRNAEQQAALEAKRNVWRGKLETALRLTGEPCSIDDISGANTVVDTWLGYIYVGRAPEGCPRKVSACELAPGKLMTTSPKH